VVALAVFRMPALMVAGAVADGMVFGTTAATNA